MRIMNCKVHMILSYALQLHSHVGRVVPPTIAVGCSHARASITMSRVPPRNKDSKEMYGDVLDAIDYFDCTR